MNKIMVEVYMSATTAEERDETVRELAKEFEVSEMQVRQTLQEANVYVEKEGKAQKEQYAHALYCVTGVEAKEFMKLTHKSQIKLMDYFRGINHKETGNDNVG